jgi:hypothetical protein
LLLIAAGLWWRLVGSGRGSPGASGEAFAVMPQKPPAGHDVTTPHVQRQLAD